jgi:PAS domain S-box-containing protein
MTTSLRLLLVEDHEDDALIILRQLKKNGYSPIWKRVETPGDMLFELVNNTWDVVLADYSLPSFNATEALAIIRGEGFDIPFIIVSGAIDEETAVAAMEAGAHDYVTKDNLIRLVPAIEREIREAEERRDRKRSEEALRRSEERFRAVVDASIDALIAITMDGSISLFNLSATHMLGYDWTEVIGRPIDMLISKEHLNDVNFFIVSHKSSKIPGAIIGKSIEIDAVKKNGDLLPVELSLSHSSQNREDFLLVIMRDISERRRSLAILEETEAQLRLSQKMEAIGRLAGGVAHDFNNLLGAILGYSDIILLDLKEEDPLKRDVMEISRAAKRAADLTRQLLVFSRRQVMQSQVFVLNEVVTGAKRMLGRLIGEDIELITNLDEKLPPIKADPSQIEQVIMNLVVNARDAMPDGGRLTISTLTLDEPPFDASRDFENTITGQCVVLKVSDTGLGINEELKSHIFEPFFTTKEKGKGTGLGLSTVYGIVNQSNGFITMQSTPGKGTTFEIYFPIVDEITEKIITLPYKAIKHPGKETILVVEDEEMLRTLISRLLKKNGYKIFQAENGAEALRLCKEHHSHIDLLLTDVVMPQMNGRELADHLRKQYPGIKTLFMSGYADDTVMRHGIFDYGYDYIQKPFSSEAISAKIREVLLKPSYKMSLDKKN